LTGRLPCIVCSCYEIIEERPTDRAQVETVASLAKIRADVGYQFVLFIQMMTSVGSIVKIFDGYKRLTGNATRFVELREVLRQIAADESRAEASSIREGDSIKFEHVMVFTPTQNKLVHDLSFEVGKSDSMLLTGHNVSRRQPPPGYAAARSGRARLASTHAGRILLGCDRCCRRCCALQGAGKSSVFRCLAGLWSIPSGTIYKPRSLAGDAEGGGSGNLGLAGTVFYLPQKPYNVLGTLADQLTYPELSSEAAGLTREKIVAILTEVDLAYLADRPEIFTKETNVSRSSPPARPAAPPPPPPPLDLAVADGTPGARTLTRTAGLRPLLPACLPPPSRLHAAVGGGVLARREAAPGHRAPHLAPARLRHPGRVHVGGLLSHGGAPVLDPRLQGHHVHHHLAQAGAALLPPQDALHPRRRGKVLQVRGAAVAPAARVPRERRPRASRRGGRLRLGRLQRRGG
jgi:hypothetical protein